LKQPGDVLAEIQRRLDRTWHESIAGDESNWPHAFPLGTPVGEELQRTFAAVQQEVFAWRDWSAARSASLRFATRRVAGTDQTLPTHLHVPDVQTAAKLCGHDRTARIARGQVRFARVRDEFPHAATGKLIRQLDAYTDVDFDLLLTAAHWFSEHTATGLTPRQVPIEGLHSKWLNARRQQVLTLAGLETLGLIEDRPHPVSFVYLDPAHIAAGRRRFDSVVPGDMMTPHYLPRVVLISENKDTAVWFPPVPDGVAVQGDGLAGAAKISQVEWMRGAERLVYWGDIDAHGFEILNCYRERGLAVETILMDARTLTRYARFAASTDAHGQRLQRAAQKSLPHLTAAEREAYLMVTAPDGDHPHRLEQERLPLVAAATQLGLPP
jgi:hypothetical protein